MCRWNIPRAFWNLVGAEDVCFWLEVRATKCTPELPYHTTSLLDMLSQLIPSDARGVSVSMSQKKIFVMRLTGLHVGD